MARKDLSLEETYCLIEQLKFASEWLENVLNHSAFDQLPANLQAELINITEYTFNVKYRFEDDPVDMVRYYECTPKWGEKHPAFSFIPADAFGGKKIILIGGETCTQLK